MDVGRDLSPAAGEQQADRPHAGQAAAGLAQAGGDGAGDLEVAAVELEVEGGERRAGGDQRGAAAPVRQAGAEVGPQLARLHPPPELGQAAVAEVGALAAAGGAGQLAIEEDRQAEAADLGRDRDRLGPGGVAVGGVEPDHRADVEGADRRVGAAVGRHVDLLERHLGAGHERFGQPPGAAGEAEDGAVVVGVAVAVEQGGAAGEGGADLRQRRLVASLGDVGDGEQGRHVPQASL